MIYKLSSWEPENVLTRSKFTGITVLVVTFGSHNIGHTKNSHTYNPVKVASLWKEQIYLLFSHSLKSAVVLPCFDTMLIL